jgi:hypothetical protein
MKKEKYIPSVRTLMANSESQVKMHTKSAHHNKLGSQDLLSHQCSLEERIIVPWLQNQELFGLGDTEMMDNWDRTTRTVSTLQSKLKASKMLSAALQEEVTRLL